MGFEEHILRQQQLHPAMEVQDMVKLCYQGAWGPAHLLTSLDQAEKYFQREYSAAPVGSGELCEAISDRYCRINLGAWKKMELPPQWLFNLFAASAGDNDRDSSLLLEYLETAERLVMEGKTPLKPGQWKRYLADYRASGMPAVHHSSGYRQAEQPSYRLVSCQAARLIPVLLKLREIMDDRSMYIVAIDGRAASGKSTSAELLKAALQGQVIHMDDFFLPKELRTDERLAQPGGNIHYERFAAQVLQSIGQPGELTYDKFDCGIMDYVGQVTVPASRFIIVEGAYSCHPCFGDYADLTVFSDVTEDEQARRIISRNGEKMAEMFKNRWIPMEEKYFSAFDIINRADVKI